MSHANIDVSLIGKLIRDLKNASAVRVINVNYKNIGEKGGNYTSEVKQIIVKCIINENGSETEEELSLFLKVMLSFDDEPLKQMLHEAHHNETAIMTGPLKQMQEISAIPRTPKFLFSHLEEPYYAIMEDLGPLGFGTVSRTAALDLQHARLVIRNLAMFHATSVVVSEKNPEYKEKLKHHFAKRSQVCAYTYIVTGYSSLVAEVSKWKEVDPKCIEKMENLKSTFFAKAEKAFTPRDGEFCVLTHGDCSQLNILFRYDEQKKPDKIAMVDFQYASYNSPALDLHYFISGSCIADVQSQDDALLKEYHSVLSESMKSVNCRTAVPSLDDIRKLYDERRFLSVVVAFLIEPILHAQPSDIIPIDDMASQDKSKLYAAAHVRKKLVPRIKEYDKLGLLDV
ncbi:uncharacterized protein LOC135163585 [Diachasmimorpha longicaudata]|uniref:uncharacterized protein LOC135163585 n=1 Tax=Diachasmimorpha longicaudata TaxID=58733 RepID=UPI0030B8E4F4